MFHELSKREIRKLAALCDVGDYMAGASIVKQGEPGDAEKQTVATAEWDGREVIVDAEDEPRRDALVRAFRRTPVVTNDPAYLRIGTSGEVVVQPGDLQWFRVVAQARVPAETGLVP